MRFEFIKLGLFYAPKQLKEVFSIYEVGQISTDDFISAIQKHTPLGNPQKIRKAWHALLGFFDERNLEILRWTRNHHRIFLLSNMNTLHMEAIQIQMGSLYKTFENQFDQLYFSHEIGMKKPHRILYEMILNENQISPNESLFIDDLAENITAAAQLGIHTWYFNIRKASLFDLNDKIKHINRLVG